MKRYAIEHLIQWKKNKNRKPLIIQGARQVGKTWLMKEFGRLYYKETIYINFDNNKQLSNVFQENINIPDIITALEILSGKKITAENSLLIFDEIQEIPNALKALKYFYEEHPEYHIICAGSLLGISISQNISFPVGKVDFLTAALRRPLAAGGAGSLCGRPLDGDTPARAQTSKADRTCN